MKIKRIDSLKAFSVLLISILTVACGKDEPPVPMSERLGSNNQSLAKEVCRALGQTIKIDTKARREILKDYDFPIGMIPRVEEQIKNVSDFAKECHLAIVGEAVLYELKLALEELEE